MCVPVLWGRRAFCRCPGKTHIGPLFFVRHEMGKMPAFQFYPGDWRRDTQVQMASMETRGVWFEMLCCMWDAPERGKIEGTLERLSTLLHCSISELERSIAEIEELKIGNVTMSHDVTNVHNHVTVINRRMYREQKDRENAKLRKRKQREREASHGSVTPPSSSSSSSSSSSVTREVQNKKSIHSRDDPIPYVEIIDYLNQKTGKAFKSQTPKTQGLIKIRWKEGFRQDDFFKAIDNQCRKWLNDPKYRDYLRPETLFGTKFESYLNAIPHPLEGRVSDTTIKNIETLKQWAQESENEK